MDDDIFDFSKEFKREVIYTNCVGGKRVHDESLMKKEVERPKFGKEYALHYQLEEQKKFLKADEACSSKMASMDDIDMESQSEFNINTPRLDIYKKYNFNITKEKLSGLPIYSSKYDILDYIDRNPVVIIQGNTGCGKTTQVPQYILDEARERNKHCNIVVTQPRRIAAISIAKRVCHERNWPLGSLVGYQIGLHAVADQDTRLLYCTTGVLLQKLIAAKNLNNYTHIILDEVHERDNEMDLLFIVIKKLLANSYGKVKVILMSATINAMDFSEYFKLPINGELMNAPIISVDKKSVHVVKEFYLCQLERLRVSFDSTFENPGISDDMYGCAVKLMMICERFDMQECFESKDEAQTKPSILIFLPGIYEIEAMYKKIQEKQDDHAYCNFIIYPLHSTITAEEQQKVFLPPPPGSRKVILSTNIAESSITVPDIKYVIDFCLTKSLITDSQTNFTTLKLEWASRSSCRQRAGRAGRVMNGRVYRLVPKEFYDYQMIEQSVPEMLRCPLENIVLKAKMLEMGTPHSILALAMDPPNLSDIANTILILKEIGALFKTVDGNYEAFDGDLTFIGRVMAALPLDVKLAKLIILGYIFNVLDDSIIIAAGLSVRNIFANPIHNALQAYGQKLYWADGSGSDIFAILNAYKVWQHRVHQNLFQNDSEYMFAKRYFLQIRALREMSALVEKIKERLKKFNFRRFYGNNRLAWREREKPLILKVVISGAFYPNYFHRSHVDEREAFAIISGRDPCNTVYYKGFDPKYLGILYEENIKIMLKSISPPKNLKVHFDTNSSRVFVTFLSSEKYIDKKDSATNYLIENIPGRVQTEVYKAVKLRKLRGKSMLSVLSPSDALAYAESHNIGEIVNGVWIPKKKPKIFNAIIPPFNVKEMIGVITHIEHCNKFYFKPSITMESLRLMHEQLQPAVLIPFAQPSDINFNEIIAAPYSYNTNKNEESGYFRAKVIKFNQTNNSDLLFDVYFIDYGNTHSVKFSELRRFDKFIDHLKNVPPCVFECYLAEISPSVINSPKEVWTIEAVNEFYNFSKDSIITAEIYSFVNQTAAVYIKKNDVYIHDILLRKGLAQLCEEHYMSKADHELRMRSQEYSDDTNSCDFSNDLNNDNDEIIDPPPPALCRNNIHLSGPYSPLETTIHSLMKSGDHCTATIEPLSVNTVLLDTDSQDCNHLVVAVNISTNKQNGQLIARNTTLMPRIKGFDVLMGLIFCPTMEINLDKTKTRYSSFLTGLGCDSNKDPLFEEHDMLLRSNVDIDVDDIEMINQIRYSMDSLLFTEPGIELPEITEENIVQVMNKFHKTLLSLLKKQRDCVNVEYSTEHSKWGKHKKSSIVEVENIYGNRAIFPFHFAVKLDEMKESDLIKLRKNCEELHKIAKVNYHNVLIDCLLCNKNLENLTQLRIHLYTTLHLNREKQINFVFEQN